jgi:hypothetical protein
MSSFMVYHHNKGNFFADKTQAEDMATNYTHVATVRVANIDEVFEVTNHIDGDWTYNEQVVWSVFHQTPRSTSVGDVVRDCVTNEYFMCMTIGWEKL